MHIAAFGRVGGVQRRSLTACRTTLADDACRRTVAAADVPAEIENATARIEKTARLRSAAEGRRRVMTLM
jgi:hypothetical protein